MKIENRTLKYFILVGLIALTNISESFGQVITRVLPPEDKIENYIPWYNPDEEIPIVNAPYVDVEAVLQEDRQTGKEMQKIGIKQDIDIVTEDGKISRKDNFIIWSLEIESFGAKAIGLKFENTEIHEDGIMYIYNEKSRFLVGPVSSRDLYDKKFRSDYVKGSKVHITIFIPSYEEPKIQISSFYHGIDDQSFNTAFGTSADCNRNVACEEGNDWGCQIESICRVLADNGGTCTGAVVNNDCCDLSAYVLTANHCIRENLDDYLFGFNWQSPECANGSNPPTGWVTYMGAELRSSWGGTDFSLLELIQNIRPVDRVSFTGWDRSGNASQTTTVLHHPRGDIKKITFDNEVAVIENDETLNYPPNIVAGRYVRVEISNGVDGDYGILEGGSSGAPYFGDSGRVFAQHRGGPILTCTNIENKWAGRVNASWEGNGTPDSRLRDWLGASTNPNTMDCMEHPFIQGPEVLCTDPQTYTLINNMPCAKTVTWRVEPANLFASPGSGNGVTASLWGNATSSGPATLIYTLSAEGCNDAEVEYDLFVGRPCTFELHSFPTEICVGEQGETLSGAAKFKADVFPNPANEFIEVACSGYMSGTRIAASLISIDGKVVKMIEEPSHHFKVNMADLPSDLYVLQLNVNGTILHEKIVKL
ncbi:MAG: T9SS type A sorting domain-containing protein [Phaeodactylibacter xiamenensis]|uniref:Secretion system C-terminal sorting domain-containing protein n=1 Tax=Phaeodactylibacter xiamenensis TaxID=1524460 RepID=A0A098SC06_9BACT|nr:T9SS type A sorting domain-containing protein [Phaeodactylibacter xiamenensis]KGE89711.1 hypothetical protein IX84_01385 [Phaeodactylibacter xiamenensis]MCR9055349.1 hypothetical protein [bacterium]